MEQNKNLPEIGYLFHFPKVDHPEDTFQLDVFVSDIPTEKHFDVQRVEYAVYDKDQIIEQLVIHHPYNIPQPAQVCAGKVIMEDRNGRKAEAFTFGGQLSVRAEENQTICSLVSAAPILDISTTNPMQKLFVEELEVIMAEQRAAFADLKVYKKRVCETEPIVLYQACLSALVKKFEDLPNKDETYQLFLFFLHSHIHRMKAAKLFSGYIIPLESIFKK